MNRKTVVAVPTTDSVETDFVPQPIATESPTPCGEWTRDIEALCRALNAQQRAHFAKIDAKESSFASTPAASPSGLRFLAGSSWSDSIAGAVDESSRLAAVPCGQCGPAGRLLARYARMQIAGCRIPARASCTANITATIRTMAIRIRSVLADMAPPLNAR